jgi:aryl-alcohol dehydrogenase
MAIAAVVEEKDAAFVLEEVVVGDLRPDEVLIDVKASGICHTDLGAQAGGFPTPLPCVLGHEGAGVVVDVGRTVSGLAVGDRVAMSYASCGTCGNCLRGRPMYCIEFLSRNFLAQRPDGSTPLSRKGKPLSSQFFGQSSFATQAVCHQRSVVKIEAEIPFELLAPFGCGIQTGAGAVLNVLRPGLSASLAVLGVGAVGMSAVMAARLIGCGTIIAVDLNEARLQLARELGATHLVNAGTTDVVETVRELTGGGADFSLECTGVPAVLREAVDMLGSDATCGVIGAPPFGTDAALDVNELIALGRRVRGIVEGESIPQLFIPELVALWAQGRFPIDRLVETFPFDQINDAVARMTDGSVVKPVVLLPRGRPVSQGFPRE